MFQQFNLTIYLIIVLITVYLTHLYCTSNLPLPCGSGCGLVLLDCWMLNVHAKLAELHVSLKTECWTVTVVRYWASAREGNNVLWIFLNMKLNVKSKITVM
jgi:hypothetical protein